jgi:putative transposase
MRLIRAVEELAPRVDVVQACEALGVSRATLYRHRQPPREAPPPPAPRPPPPRTLGSEERAQVLEVLHSERFVDVAPAEVVATLLDEGAYHCSARTMHRILAAEGEAGERRAQRSHPARPAPILEATAPNQVWSWDITRLEGPRRWSSYALYVVLDIFSRYVVGWMVADRELAKLAARLIETCVEREGVRQEQLTLHQDRGAPMIAKTFSQTLVDLGVLPSYSRPRVSNDNPFSESHFKTLKYMPTYPGRFESIEESRAWCARFIEWYNHEHRHSGIAMLRPFDVHVGRAEDVLRARQQAMDEAFARHPERFVNGAPRVAQLPSRAHINCPTTMAIRVVTADSEAVGVGA